MLIYDLETSNDLRKLEKGNTLDQIENNDNGVKTKLVYHLMYFEITYNLTPQQKVKRCNILNQSFSLNY